MYWFNTLDRLSIQYLLMSVLNLVSIFSIPFIFKEIDIKKIFYDPLSLTYFGYLLFAFLSMTASINIIESFVKIFQLITFFFSLVIIIFIAKEKLIKINFVLYIIFISLIIDVVSSMWGYYQMSIKGIEYSYTNINYLLGLFGNRNLLSLGIIFRIPLVVLLAVRVNKISFSLVSSAFITIAFFNVILLSSRAALLSIIICMIIILGSSLFRYIKIKKNFFSDNKLLFYFFILPFIVAYVISLNNIDSRDQSYVTSRLSSITSSNDESKNARIGFYGHALTQIKETPIFGCGIGNWKILSIKYDAENMENYIVPHNTHNDILEAAAETGVLGGLFFISFFVSIFLLVYNCYKIYSDDSLVYNYSIILMLPLIIYLIDLNLNFPSSRPFFLYLLLMYVIIVYLFKSKINEKA
tara:strand:+ start:1106 stop:2338 length:1233 start_codon:yes stop_codon:yes gene_type:complete